MYKTHNRPIGKPAETDESENHGSIKLCCRTPRLL